MINGSGKKVDQKLKPYLVYNYLLKYSDFDHPIAASELVAYLEETGISAERRSIYKDIEEINRAIYINENDCTIEEADEALEDESEKIIIYDASKKGFYVRYRKYDINDIHMLAECINTAKFINENQAKTLISVVTDLVSESQAEKIKNDCFLIDRVKTSNKSMYYYISRINEAMSTSIDGEPHTPEKISFKYLKCTIQNVENKVERKGGATYVVSPYKVLINDGNYYLLAYDDSSKEMRTYRIDRMKNVSLTGIQREGKEAFEKINLKTYTQRLFSMFGGDKETVTIAFNMYLLDTIVERFGTRNAYYRKIDDHHFSVTTDIEISDQFYGWLCGFGKKARLASPHKIVDEFKSFINCIKDRY